MNSYIVESGELKADMKAISPEMAVMKCIELYDPKALGLIISCKPEVGEEIFFKTEFILKSMGTPIQ